MNFEWLYVEGNLDILCDSTGAINWDAYGFTVPAIRWAVANGYQKPNENGTMISMFPIENKELFDKTLGAVIAQLDQANTIDTSAPWRQVSTNGHYRVITQEECDTIHANLVALEKSNQEEAALTPSDDEVYRAQQLLFLAKINNNLEGAK